VSSSKKVEIELEKLTDKTRRLSLSASQSSSCPEIRLVPAKSVARQKERWLRAFETILHLEQADAT